MPEFWICHGSEYAGNLNTPGFWMYQGSEYNRVLNIPRFWIYQGSKYIRDLNIPGFWICKDSEYSKITQDSECIWIISLDNSWICLIMSEYTRMLSTNSTLFRPVSLRLQFAIFKKQFKREFALFSLNALSHMFGRFSNMLEILNISGFWIWLWF